VRVLYGGSVDAHDVKGFLSIKGIDGVLVGAASISANKFVNIVSAAYQTHTEVQ
jgi:triosephosphate isomerase